MFLFERGFPGHGVIIETIFNLQFSIYKLRWFVGKRGLATWFYYYVYLAISWSLFRYLVRLPEVIEELWFKPVIWLAPLLFLMVSKKTKFAVFGKNNLVSLGMGLLLGGMYFLLFRWRLGDGFSVSMDAVGVALVIATVEQLAFAGVSLPLLAKESGNQTGALVVTSLGFALLRIPINLFVSGLSWNSLLIVILLGFGIQIVNGFLRLKMKNTWVAIGAHFGLILAGLH
jgi:hypothetical protein